MAKVKPTPIQEVEIEIPAGALLTAGGIALVGLFAAGCNARRKKQAKKLETRIESMEDLVDCLGTYVDEVITDFFEDD